VYVGVSDDGAVFLDLESDAYSFVERDQALALSFVVEGWPQADILEGEYSVDHLRSIEDGAAELARILCEGGLLTPATERLVKEREAVPRLPQADSELIAWCDMSPRHVRPVHVFRFLRSVATAALLLRFRRFSRVVGRIRSRRNPAARMPCSFDMEAARKLMSAYTHIRPFVYGQKSRCLLDSLTLLEFLACDGVYPAWVIGVQVHPFGSHSWLQHQSYVLNGTPAYVRAYTPILAI
jgi:hypothetical protein